MESKKEFPGFAHALGLVAVVFLLQIFFAVPLAADTKIEEHPAIIAVASLAAFGFVLLWGIQRTGKPPSEVLPLPPVRGALLVPIVLSILGLAILLSELDNLVRVLLPPPQAFLELFKEITESKILPWESFLALVIVAPLTEELFFRGLILRGFLGRYSGFTAVVLSAFLFGALHGNPWQFCSATVLGVVFAWWFLRTRSLLPCLMGHSLNNALVLCAPLLPMQVRGFNVVDSFTHAQFQPPWFDAAGLVLLCLGLWLFAFLSPRPVGQPVPAA